MFRAGEVWLADLYEGGSRPVVIVSRDELNQGGLALAVPITSARVAERRQYRNYVFLPRSTGGLRHDSLAVAHMVQPLRRELVIERWGALSDPLLREILVALAWAIGVVK